MVTQYLQWQFVLAPRWLFALVWNLHRALFQFFSVSVMIRTLLSPWRKDSVSYRGIGGIFNVLKIFFLNQISRLIGFIIRAIVIAMWLGAEFLFIAFSGFTVTFFLLSPLVIILGIWWAFVSFIGL